MKNKVISTPKTIQKIINYFQKIFSLNISGNNETEGTKAILNPWRIMYSNICDNAVFSILTVERELRDLNKKIEISKKSYIEGMESISSSKKTSSYLAQQEKETLEANLRDDFDDIKNELESAIEKIKGWLAIEDFDHHYPLVCHLFEMINDCATRIGEPDLVEKTTVNY